MASQPAASATPPKLQNFGRIPLSFEANRGQTDAQVQYLARGPGYTLFLTATEAVLALTQQERPQTPHARQFCPAKRVGTQIPHSLHLGRPERGVNRRWCACNCSAAIQRRRLKAPIG